MGTSAADMFDRYCLDAFSFPSNNAQLKTNISMLNMQQYTHKNNKSTKKNTDTGPVKNPCREPGAQQQSVRAVIQGCFSDRHKIQAFFVSFNSKTQIVIIQKLSQYSSVFSLAPTGHLEL